MSEPAPPSRVGILVRLKLTLLRNGLRRSPWQVVAFVLGALWALSLVVSVGGGLVALRFSGLDLAVPVVVGGGSVVVLGWAFLPLIAFGVDETLDPSRFATFALPRRDMVVGLLIAGLIGLPGISTLLLALATVVTFSRSVPATLLALLMALVGVLTAVAASRATTTAASALLHARRSRDVLVIVGGLLLVLFGPGFNLLLNRAGDLQSAARSVAAVAGWTPPGFAWAAAGDAARGAWGSAALRAVLALAVLVGVLACWAMALGRNGTGPVTGSSGSGRVESPSSKRFFDRLPPSPTTAVAARCLSYWRRDPRYLISAVSLAVIPLLLLVLPLSQGQGLGRWLLAAGPLAAFVAGWSLHNDVGYDHSAFALHVVTGLPGRADRAGRVFAALSWQLPAVLVLCVLGALAPGRADLLPAVIGAALALLGAGLGVSSVASALTPYPAPAPGSNPFQAPRGASAAAIAAQFATTGITTALAVPALVPAVLALVWTAWFGWLALVVGVGAGALWLWLGVTRGGAVLDRRAPEVLATVSSS
ncbi:MAG: hypothetical protein ACRYF3_03275 [Janthinobacterium lividum]